MNLFNGFARLGRQRLLAFTMVLSTISVFSNPASATTPLDFDINGDTITFNYHDWFQVQSASNYHTFCEGWQPCVLPDGDYIVINHVYDERYNVTIDTSGGGGGGNGDTETLTWPNDGWYQVQDAVTYRSICEGGSSCVVHPGKYFVINLTTGHRRTVTVPTGGPTGDPGTYSDFTISGNTVTFTAHGWFQVQDQFTYAPACEGFVSCTVANGTYQVINLTTGKKFMNVVVNGGFEPAAAVINSSNYRAIVKNALEVYSGQAYDDRLALFPYFINKRNEFNGPASNFNCGNGGSLSQYYVQTRSSVDTLKSTFHNCQWGSNGIFGIYNIGYNDVVSGSINDVNNPGGHNKQFTNFVSVVDSQTRMEVNGKHITRCCGPYVSMITENLNYYFTYPQGTLRVSNANTTLKRNFREGELKGDFTFNSSVTGLNDIYVNTTVPLLYNSVSIANQGTVPYLWTFSYGQLSLTSPSDGSSVTIYAETGNPDTVTVSISSANESKSFTDNWNDWREALACTRESCESYSIPGNIVSTTPY